MIKHSLLFFALVSQVFAAASFYYPVTQPYKIYTDKDGSPLNNGYIFFGVANQNPEASPIDMFWDPAGNIKAAQPIRTINGYIVRSGTPANIYAAGDFSVTIKNSKQAFVFNSATSVDLQLALSIAGSSSAAAIPIADAGGYYSTDNVEAALQQVGPLIGQMVTALAGSTPTGARIGFVGTTAPTGWVLGSGRTISKTGSGGTERANDDTSALYTLLWNSYAHSGAGTLVIQDNAGTPTTYGASASNDFSAGKRLSLPDDRGRVPGGKDDMGGSTAGRLTAAGMGAAQIGTAMGSASTGATGFTETHAMITAELASHTHTATDSGHTHTFTGIAHAHTVPVASGATPAGAPATGTTQGGSTNTSSVTAGGTNATGFAIVTNSSTGSNTPFSVVQPTIIETFIIKL